jgi:hypothetical protein
VEQPVPVAKRIAVLWSPDTAGKDARVRVKKAGRPEVTEIQSWGAHERVNVKRA